MILAGIDPGLSGAIAFLSTEGECATFDMPIYRLLRGGKNKGEIDPHALAQLLRDRCPGHAFVEGMRAMPGQGVTSMFALGKGYGIILGVLAAVGVPYTVIDARKWKRALAAPAEKDGARARASQLLPAAAGQWPLKKNDGRAEAALIAFYGIRAFNEIGEAPGVRRSVLALTETAP